MEELVVVYHVYRYAPLCACGDCENDVYNLLLILYCFCLCFVVVVVFVCVFVLSHVLFFGRVDCVRNCLVCGVACDWSTRVWTALRAGMRMGSRLDGVTAGRHQTVSVCF